MKITYYLEVLSSWCYWSEPAWAELKRRYAGQVEFEWKIALMKPQDFPASQAQCEWFYRRSGTVMRAPFMLNSGWFEASRAGNYDAPNLVAEAARSLGFSDDRVRLAIATAAVREGKKVGDLEVAVAAAATVQGVDAKKLRELALSPAVRERVLASTAEFHAHQITQRPAFVLEDEIGDKAVFSGLVRFDPLAATIDTMLFDTASYASHKVHFGTPPAV